MPPPPAPTPAPQQHAFFEEYDPNTAYPSAHNNKRKKYTPIRIDEYNNESNTKQV